MTQYTGVLGSGNKAKGEGGRQKAFNMWVGEGLGRITKAWLLSRKGAQSMGKGGRKGNKWQVGGAWWEPSQAHGWYGVGWQVLGSRGLAWGSCPRHMAQGYTHSRLSHTTNSPMSSLHRHQESC